MPPELQQKPEEENPSHNFPGSADEEQSTPGGTLATLADNPALDEIIPLLGTATGLIRGGLSAWDAHTYGSMADEQRKEGFDPAQTNANQQAADHAAQDAEGHFINAIPLVGFARALM